MNWWNIVKNLKGKGKAKGSTLDASKIKVNIKENCKDKLKQYYDNAVRINGDYMRVIGSEFVIDLEDMPEETACKIVDWVESLPLFPLRYEMLDFFEKYIDNYFVSVYLGRQDNPPELDENLWELDLYIVSKEDKFVLNIETRQERDKPVESIDMRK
jgi:hypothetical protein